MLRHGRRHFADTMIKLFVLFVAIASTLAQTDSEICKQLIDDPACSSNGNVSPCSNSCGPGVTEEVFYCDHGGEFQQRVCRRPCNLGACPKRKTKDCAALLAAGCIFSARSECSKTCGIGEMTESWYCQNMDIFLHQCQRSCCLRPCDPKTTYSSLPKVLCRDTWPPVKLPPP